MRIALRHRAGRFPGARVWILASGLSALAPSSTATANKPLQIGSKKFTESVILGEIARASVGAVTAAEPTHRRELGGTQVLWKALKRGDVDVYPEYTGTIAVEVLREPGLGIMAIRDKLAQMGVGMGAPLGFNNTYALGLQKERANALGLERVSQLRDHASLRFGFTAEFMERADGWPGLRRHYRLPQQDVRGLDHDLAYRGLMAGTLDLIDLYSTDAEISYYGLSVLHDDQHYFPSYEAVFLYRKDLPTSAKHQLARIAGRIDAETMRKLNAAVKLAGHSEQSVARTFLEQRGIAAGTAVAASTWQATLLQHARDHLLLVAVSLSAGIVVAVPLGILAARRLRLAQVVLAACSILQTIPSLALLVIMIPLLGIGAPPAIAALFLYSLLPIVRNTYTGLVNIEAPLLESAEALGLHRNARLRLIELPLATPSILAGIKTAAVINVGTATLGALVGAGGFGQPILTGIRLDDTGLIMQGALPAAALALAVQWSFDLVERRLVRPGR